MRYLWTIILALIFCGFAWGGWWYISHSQILSDKKVVERVIKLMVLPDEVPTVATVTDQTKLGEHQFFEKARNGDRVLIFPQAAKAILYRPATDKIIEVSTISSLSEFQQNNPTPTPTTVTKKIKVAVYNGSGKVGMASNLADEVLAKIDYFEVVKKADAKGIYLKSLLVDVAGNNGEIVKTLAEELEGEVKNLPESEVKPVADILIIVGQNYVK